MKREYMYKAIIAIAVAMAFVMPVAAFANVGTFGITSNSENTVDINNMAELITIDNSDTKNTEIPSLLSLGDIYVDDDADPSWYNETQVRTITEGINNATIGDTVYVYNGVYYEHVVVYKQLDLTGESKENVIIDGSSSNGNVVQVTVNDVNISTFTMRNDGDYYGIYLWKNSNNNITNCDTYGCTAGIYLWRGSNNNITNCDVYNNTYGIYINEADDNNFMNCNVYNNSKQFGSIHISASSYNNFANCNVYDNDGHGFCFWGTYSEGSTHNSVTNCNVYGNRLHGIHIYKASNSNDITNCTLYNNSQGIYIDTSSYNSITDCDMYNNTNHGIYIYKASGNELSGNTIHDNVYNFGIVGIDINHFHQNIAPSNTVNGKPMYYLVDRENEILDGTIYDLGYLALISCTNITAKNADVNGIFIIDTTDSTVSNVSSHNSEKGIYLWMASNNDIINCTLYNNSHGIYLDTSPYNSITDCEAYNNNNYGIYLYRSSGNELSGNTIHDNVYNFGVEGTNIYHFHQDIAPSNTVNEKPMYYLVDRENEILDGTTYDFGYLGLISCTNITAKNSDTEGIVIVNTTKSTISNVSSHNSGNGIYLWNASNNDIINCDAYNNQRGIYLWNASNSNITNCDAYSNSKHGIYTYYSSNSNITNCDAYSNSEHGIFIYFSSNCSNNIINCNSYNNQYGICIRSSPNCSNNIINCNSYNNTWGIYLYNLPNCNITDCAVYNNSQYGIHIHRSPKSKLIGNAIYDNVYNFEIAAGVYPDIQEFYHNIDSSNTINGKPMYYLIDDENMLLDGTIYDFGYLALISCTNITAKNSDVCGILLANTSYSTISNIISHNSGKGVYIYTSSNNDIINCSVYNNGYGIYLESSSDNNIMDCDSCNNSGYSTYSKYEGGYGIYLESSSDNSILNCSVYNNHFQGIYLFQSPNNNDITNCKTYNNNEYGIYLDQSPNCNITDCAVYNNSQYGIYIFRYSSYSNIINCDVYSNSQYGIYIYLSSNCNVINCDSYNNEYGIYIRHNSNYNLIYHNNFVDNDQTAYDVCLNTWDDGYPSGGNYWDDYSGVDNYSGPSQNIPGSDGIGDTPYIVPVGPNQDNYPLMVPFGDIEVPPLITNVQATPSVQKPGEPLNITCTVTDDIMVDTVTVNITTPSYSTDEFIMTNMPGTDDYYYNTTYAENGTYDYFIWTNDTSGNNATSNVYHFVISEFDMTPPVISEVTIATSDPLDTEPGFGWENFSCTVTDNTAVDEVKLVLTGDTITEYPMTKDGDDYYCNITIEIADEYTYHIWANDTSDNENTSAPQPFDLPLNADVNEDGSVGFVDIMMVAGMWNALGPNGWDRADVNNDGEVGFVDIMMVAGQWGQEW